jgi:class 3 adenylate cyclase
VPTEVTFLLTEVVDSIRRWEADEAGMEAATARLDALVGAVVADHRGIQVKPRGEGDSHFLTFEDPVDAVACAVALQRALNDESALALRSGCHVGLAELRDGDWYGTTVNRCARLRAVAHPRQSLVSAEVAAAVATRLPETVSLRSLGRHRLKDLDEPAEVFQLCAPGLRAEHPPLPTLGQSHGLPLPRSSFVGREAECERVVALLQRGGVVAVTGPPGVGTTRFVLEAAARWWECEGKAVRVVTAPNSRDQVLASRAAADELVVVLDAGNGLADATLPGPILLTARAPLGIAGESDIRLGPLNEFDSERLLRDRLPDEASLPAGLAAYCDGIPLAVELLARRAAAIDAATLSERLRDDPLAVLGGDRRAEPSRHASIRATFLAAYEALDDATRDLLHLGEAGDPRLVAAGWHEPDGPLPLVARFLSEVVHAP